MKRYKIDYDNNRNCFEDISDVQTDLIWGDLDYIKDPYISYVIPCYKRADLLKKTLHSILNQKPVCCPWNIIIVDNDPSENSESEELIRNINDPKILYFRNQKNIGVDGNYNRCIEIANSKWVAMIHADDLIMNDHLTEMVSLLNDKSIISATQKPAYICQRYIEFSDESFVILDRDEARVKNNKYSFFLDQIYNKGKPELLTQNYALFTGVFAALPSFGTLINREIMLQEGGFDKELGICEDVITPYKLAKKYGVYMAPRVMGFYRFNNNESMKAETILKIYASILDFREYVFSKNIMTNIWGNISRDILAQNLRNYCIGLSRFSNKHLCSKDFDDIYTIHKVSNSKKFFMRCAIGLFNKIHGLRGYKEIVNDMIDCINFEFQTMSDHCKGFILYGIGSVADVMIPIIKSKYKSINIICCAVSDKAPKEKNFHGYNVEYIGKLTKYKEEYAVITATEIWEFQSEMNDTLSALGFKNVINLLH